jgi:hypothetical protein
MQSGEKLQDGYSDDWAFIAKSDRWLSGSAPPSAIFSG